MHAVIPAAYGNMLLDWEIKCLGKRKNSCRFFRFQANRNANRSSFFVVEKVILKMGAKIKKKLTS